MRWWILAAALAALGVWPLAAVDAERVPARAGLGGLEPVEESFATSGDPARRTGGADAPRPAPRHEGSHGDPIAAAPAPPAVPQPDEPATPAAARVLRLLDRVDRRVEQTRYQHQTFVAEWRGLYAWDCSGMVNWVLERAARGARNRILSVRPVARDYVEIIESSPLRGSYKGWQKIAHIEDLRPGDLFAWKRPRNWPRDDTGHVGFVLARPRPVPGHHRAYRVRVADATSVPHENDTREEDGAGGFGRGTMLFTVDDGGSPVAYGWYGASSDGVVPTHVAFGRVHY
ncbi:MAG: hypothetical protein ACODAU_00345 [Myxococcota bacterium]